MSPDLLADSVTGYIIESVETPDDWYPVTEENEDDGQRVYPEEQPMAGTVLLMGWRHKRRPEEVILGVAPEGHEGFGIDIQIDTGTYHAHGAKNLEGACEAVSMATYMLNHGAYEHQRSSEREEELQDTVEALREQVNTYKSRAEYYESKNDMLRSQMNTLINTMSSGYDDGDWRGMVQRSQQWRPPSREELLDLAIFIDRKWYENSTEDEDDISKGARSDVSEAFIIVLDGFAPFPENNDLWDEYEARLMFYHEPSQGMYSVFMWNEAEDLIYEVLQAEAMKENSSNDLHTVQQ